MSDTRKTWTAEEHDEATSKADDLSMKLYGLTQVVKLAAFAAETRKAPPPTWSEQPPAPAGLRPCYAAPVRPRWKAVQHEPPR